MTASSDPGKRMFRRCAPLLKAGDVLSGLARPPPVPIAFGRWVVTRLYDEVDLEALDPITFTWWIHRQVDPAELPEQRVVGAARSNGC